MPKTNDRKKWLPKIPEAENGSIEILFGSVWKMVVDAPNKIPDHRTYTYKEVLNITRVKQSQLNHLIQTRAVIPFEEVRGRGGRSIYNFQNLLEILLAREFRRYSMSVSDIKRILDNLRKAEFRFSLTTGLKYKNSGGEFVKDADEARENREVARKIQKGELPGLIEREHNIFEYLTIYPLNACQLYYISGSIYSEMHKGHVFINKFEESLFIYEAIKPFSSLLLIDLFNLKHEAENGVPHFYYGPPKVEN